MGSYFELYQFILQSMFLNEYSEFKEQEELKEYCTIINKNKNYRKNLLKIMYLPLAYNLARYNNITNEKIFNSKDRSY